jgi:hypothetical protein
LSISISPFYIASRFLYYTLEVHINSQCIF